MTSVYSLSDGNVGNGNEKLEVKPTTPPNGLVDDSSAIAVKTEGTNPGPTTNGSFENSDGDSHVVPEEADSSTPPNGLVAKHSEESTSADGETTVSMEPNGLMEKNNETVNVALNTNPDSPEKIGGRQLKSLRFLEIRNHSASNGLLDGKEKYVVLDSTEIKHEDPLDIEDALNVEATKRMPIISLTPTSKLMATPNPTNPKRKFVCPYENCGKSYGKSSHLRSHLTWHTGIKPFVCQEPNCGKGFTRSDELNRHVRTHTGEKPFECVQCTKKFSRSDHLTKHLATHAKQQRAPRRKASNLEEQNVPKIPINRNPKRRVDMETDITYLRPYEPPVNNRRLAPASTLNPSEFLRLDYSAAALKTKHQPIKIKLERPDNNSEYQIVPTSILKNNLKLRAGTINEEEEDEDEDDEEDDANGELIIGDDEIMPEANAPPLLYDVVIKSEPVEIKHEPECPSYPCDQCSQTFQCLVDLNRHRQEHAIAQVVTAATDNNESPNPQLIEPKLEPKAPQMIKDPQRPYNCTECPKTFRRQDDLQRHFRTHTGEKPFPCNECDRRFVRSDHLKKHLQTHIRVRCTQFFALHGPTKNNS